MTEQNQPLERTLLSLEGLSVGDALGQQFFKAEARAHIGERWLPPAPWHYTDDTQMALSIYSVLRQYRWIEQSALATSFAGHYEGGRGYGPSMHYQLRSIQAGENWQEASRHQFEGQGSYGNGAAMRVTPLGAFFADDLERVVEQARLSAEVTHTHEEGVAGAIAVAIAAAQAWRIRQRSSELEHGDFLDLILPFLPDSEVRTKTRRARNMSRRTSIEGAVSILGNGLSISAQDTVPFVLWCAGQHLGSYEEAIWFTLQGMGDIDTNCAMVGGIVALSSGRESIPQAWLEAREPLAEWAFSEQTEKD